MSPRCGSPGPSGVEGGADASGMTAPDGVPWFVGFSTLGEEPPVS